MTDVKIVTDASVNWKFIQLVHGIQQFYREGTMSFQFGHRVYDWLNEMQTLTFDEDEKKTLWTKAMKECNNYDHQVKFYKTKLAETFLSRNSPDGITLSIEVKKSPNL